jgi:hypothetical protein
MVTISDLREQAQRLVDIAKGLLKRQRTEQVPTGRTISRFEESPKAETVRVFRVPAAEAATWDTRVRVLLSQPMLSRQYFEAFEKRCRDAVDPGQLEAGAAQLEALIADIEDGHLPSIAVSAHSTTLSDLLDQAEGKGDDESVSAVMLIGGVLEAHLRFIGGQRNIPITGDSAIGKWNEALHTAGVYDKTMRHMVGTWAKLRNDADHLLVQKFERSAVQSMMVGVRTLMQTLPQ